MKMHILCLALALPFLFACEAGPRLPSGVKFVAVDGGNHALIKSDSFVAVLPNVTSCAAADKYIVGRRERPASPYDSQYTTGFGYFVYNAESQQLQQSVEPSIVQKILTAAGKNLRDLNPQCS